MAKKKKIKKRIVWDINDLDIKNKEKLNAVAVKYDLKKDKTLIIIAHRVSKLSKCDIIYELKNGTLNKVD